MANPNSRNVLWQTATVQREDRHKQNTHRSVVLWFTGLPCAGKSTLARAVEQRLYALGCHSYVLDGDNVRHGLCADLGFSPKDRAENIRRIGEASKLMLDAGLITLAAFISPFRADRERVRNLFDEGDFIEVYCACELAVCEARDVKGLYKRARSGDVREFTGVSSPYEPPLSPELVVDTARDSLQDCVEQVLKYLHHRNLLKS